MDYFTQPLANTLLPAEGDQRRSPRKRLHRRVVIGLSQGSIIRGYTSDVSPGGLAILITDSIAIGEVCSVHFDILINGQAQKITGAGKVVSCICSGVDGFRVGLQFKARDAQAEQIIEDYMQC